MYSRPEFLIGSHRRSISITLVLLQACTRMWSGCTAARIPGFAHLAITIQAEVNYSFSIAYVILIAHALVIVFRLARAICDSL